MIRAATDHPGLAVRRAARTAGSTAALFTLLSLTEQWGPNPATSDRSGLPYHLGVVVTLVALAPGVVLLPVAVRMLAHPRGGPLPASAAASAVTGVLVSLCWLAGGLGLLAAHWLVTKGPAPDGSVVTRLVVAALGVGVTAGGLLAARQVRAIRAERPAAGPVPVGAVRPDLVDDLATLAARTFPGSGLARAAAALNRRVDALATTRPDLPPDPATLRRGRIASALVTRLVRFRPQPD